MLIPHLMPVLMALCFILGLWVRLPTLIAAALSSLGFFLLGLQWDLPLEQNLIDLLGRTFFNDAFQALCLIFLMALLMERAGWTIKLLDAIDELLGPLGLWVLAAMLWLAALWLVLFESSATIAIATVYVGMVFLAVTLFMPFTLHFAMHFVAQPRCVVAILASILILLYMLGHTLEGPFVVSCGSCIEK